MLWLRRPLLWFVFLVLLVPPAEAARSCIHLLGRLTARAWNQNVLGLSADLRELGVATWNDLFAHPHVRFNAGDVAAFRQLFLDRMREGRPLTDADLERIRQSRPAATLAILEAAAEHSGNDVLQLRAHLASASPKESKRLIEALNGLDNSKAVDRIDLHDFIDRLYVTVNTPERDYPSLPHSLGRRLPTPLRQSIRKRVETEILRQDLVSAMRALGILRDPGLVQRAELWLREHPNVVEGINTAALNTFSMVMFGVPIHLPNVNLSSRIPPHLIERVRREGFEAVYPELERLYGRSEWWNRAVGAARKTAYTAASGAILYLLGSLVYQNPQVVDPRYWWFIYRFGSATPEDLEKAQENNFDEHQVRREQFESFREAYEEQEGPFEAGRPPAPWEPDYEQRLRAFPPGYRLEAERTWRNLLNTPAERLRVNFRPSAPKSN